MKQLEQRAREFFEMKRFYYRETEMGSKKEYRCVSVEFINQRILIKTTTRSFTFSSEQKYLAFESDVQIISSNDLPMKAEGKKSHNAILVSEAPEYLQTVSSNLYEMFGKLSTGKVSDDELKIMRAAADMAGKICDVEKVKLSYLSKI